MRAITVRYRGPTNFTGSCLIARCEDRHIIVGWDSALNREDNYTHAAMALVHKLGLANREWAYASLPGNSVRYVFVPVLHGINIVSNVESGVPPTS